MDDGNVGGLGLICKIIRKDIRESPSNGEEICLRPPAVVSGIIDNKYTVHEKILHTWEIRGQEKVSIYQNEDSVNNEAHSTCSDADNSIGPTVAQQSLHRSKIFKSVPLAFTDSELHTSPMLYKGIYSNEKGFTCGACGEAFVEENDVIKHLRMHENDEPSRCSKCGKTFGDLKDLFHHACSHSRQHETPRSRESPCNSSGDNQALAQGVGPKRRHTSEKTEKESGFHCDVCGKGFSKKQVLQRHLLIHNKRESHVCLECGKSFAQKRYLRQHEQTHVLEKTHVCGECGKAFTHRGDLTKHSRIHTGERPYVCGVCGRTFKQTWPYLYHTRTHSGNKPHACTICGRAFTQKCDLLNHCRTHTGEKPFSCEVCGRAFAVKSNLRKHLQIHTGERPHRCGNCGGGFSRRRELEKHLCAHTLERTLSSSQSDVVE